MATGNKTYAPFNPKLFTSFSMPEGCPAMGIAPVCTNKAWMMVVNCPMVQLIDTDGHVHQTAYVVEEMRKVREKTSLAEMLTVAMKRQLEIQRIAPSISEGCFVMYSEQSAKSIKHISKNGSVSTVISGLSGALTYGIAYIPDTSEKGKVLFNESSKGMCTVKWPRNRLLSLFSSPAVDTFYPVNDSYSDFAVDKNSDLISAMTFKNKIVFVNKKGQKVSEYTPEDTDTNLDQSLSFDHTGCVIVFKSVNSSIYRISPDGHFVQTLFPETEKNESVCDECKQSGNIKCRECKFKTITAVSVHDDCMWLARLTGDVELYKLQ